MISILSSSKPNTAIATLTARINGAQFASYRGALQASGGRFIGDNKNEISVARLPSFVAEARKAGLAVQISEDLAQAIERASVQAAATVKAAESRADDVAEKLSARGAALFPFQRAGVRWLAGRSSGLLSDEMGTGKTLQTLVAIPTGAPVLVVCPAVAKAVWRREAAQWRPDLEIVVLSGRGSFVWPKPGQIVVTNYDILPESLPESCPAGLVVVADEAHALKSPKAQRTARFRAIAKLADRKYALTATPLLNRPSELWTLLQTFDLAKTAFGSYPQFLRTFGGELGKFGIEWTGRIRESAAQEGLERVMLRRMKKDVLKDLPAKMHSEHACDIGAALRKQLDKLALELEAKGLQVSESATEAEIDRFLSACPGFENLSKFRAKLAEVKFDSCEALLDEYEEQGAPVVVASAHRFPIDRLAARPGWAVITGDTSPDERGRIQEAFQAGNLRGVGLTIQAGGVAITLTRASAMIFVDHSWTPLLDAQCEDRIHRIGQQNACVYTHLVADHAVDRMIARTVARKLALVAASVDAASKGADDAVSCGADEMAEFAVIASELVSSEVEQAVVNASAPRAVKDKLGRKIRIRDAANAHHASTDAERFAANGLLTLAALDDDHVKERNGVGFSLATTSAGHALAALLEAGLPLLDADWQVAIKICQTHRKQLA